MAEVTVEVQIECSECHGDLKAEMYRGHLEVTPCNKCNDESYEEGIKEGKKEAKE